MHGDPTSVANAWAAGLGRANAKITAGVQAVTVSPQSRAVAQAPAWQTAVSSQAALDKYKASLSRQTLADWATPMLGKGIARIGPGATAAVPKFTTFLTTFLPFLDGVTARVRAMPSGSLEANISRMEAQIRGVAAFKR